jgi:carbon storage regulator CsrA
MLVLTRKANQQIQIGENVVITVLAVKGNSVRLGIEAPREVRVVRGELERKENAALAETPVPAEVFDAVEMIVPQGARAEVVVPTRQPVASSSPKQPTVESAVIREVRCSPLLRYVAAGAATDAPGARFQRDAERAAARGFARS